VARVKPVDTMPPNLRLSDNLIDLMEHFSLSSAQGIGRAWGIPLRASTPLPERRLEVPFNSPVAAADAGRMCLRPLTQSDKTSLGPISSRKDWASAIPSASLGSQKPAPSETGEKKTCAVGSILDRPRSLGEGRVPGVERQEYPHLMPSSELPALPE
jgi:hypothetical protein